MRAPPELTSMECVISSNCTPWMLIPRTFTGRLTATRRDRRLSLDPVRDRSSAISEPEDESSVIVCSSILSETRLLPEPPPLGLNLNAQRLALDRSDEPVNLKAITSKGV